MLDMHKTNQMVAWLIRAYCYRLLDSIQDHTIGLLLQPSVPTRQVNLRIIHCTNLRTAHRANWKHSQQRIQTIIQNVHRRNKSRKDWLLSRLEHDVYPVHQVIHKRNPAGVDRHGTDPLVTSGIGHHLNPHHEYWRRTDLALLIHLLCFHHCARVQSH
jgi:hypothetical protein